MDISCRQNLDTDLEDYLKIMWKLTADAEACTCIGAILGGGSENEIQALAEFGRRVGFIVLLEEELSDSLNREGALPHRLKYESVPLPILYAAKSSRETFIEVKSNVQKPPNAAIVSDLIELCWKTRAVTYVYNLAQQNAAEAARKLEPLKPTKALDALTSLMDDPLRYMRREYYVEKRYRKLCL